MTSFSALLDEDDTFFDDDDTETIESSTLPKSSFVDMNRPRNSSGNVEVRVAATAVTIRSHQKEPEQSTNEDQGEQDTHYWQSRREESSEDEREQDSHHRRRRVSDDEEERKEKSDGKDGQGVTGSTRYVSLLDYTQSQYCAFLSIDCILVKFIIYIKYYLK